MVDRHIQLLVGVPEARLRARWQAVFGDIREIEVAPIGMKELRARHDVQCLVVSNREVEEHWGGQLILDGVQFCSTARYFGYEPRPPVMPPYVVSTVAFGPQWRADNHTREAIGARRLTLILRRLEQANTEGADPHIRRLAFAGERRDAAATVRHLEQTLQGVERSWRFASERGDTNQAINLDRERQELARRLAEVRASPGAIEAEFYAVVDATHEAYLAYLRD